MNEEEVLRRKELILSRLLEQCPDAIISECLSPDGEIVKQAREQHKGLDLFIKCQKETVYLGTKKGKDRIHLDQKLKITDVARAFGFNVKNNKIPCPFHKEKDPSLSLNDNINAFYCFGCRKKGDILEFIRRLLELGYKR